MTNTDNGVPSGLESLGPIQLLRYLLSQVSRDVTPGPVVEELIIAKDPEEPMQVRRTRTTPNRYRITTDDGLWQDERTGEVTAISNPRPDFQGVTR